MARQPKPYYRKVQERWVCSIDGNRITPGQGKKEAHAKFYELTQVYLDWVQSNRTESTYDKHKYYLKSFIKSVGKLMKPGEMPYSRTAADAT